MDEFNEEINHKDGNINGCNHNFYEVEDFLKHLKKRKLNNLVRHTSSLLGSNSRNQAELLLGRTKMIGLSMECLCCWRFGKICFFIFPSLSRASKIERKESQCRNMLEPLKKKKYNKEKLKMEQMGFL